MIPPPISPGLYLCDYVIVEENTRKVSLIGCFTRIRLEQFPAIPQPFSVFSTLTDGSGNARIRLALSQPNRDEIIYQREGSIHFPDKLTEVYVHFRVRECEFPEPGLYEFTLFVDNEWVAQRPVRVYRRGELP
jgi:hypothetical protein